MALRSLQPQHRGRPRVQVNPTMRAVTGPMMPSPSGPTGMYAGTPPLPQNPVIQRIRELMASLTGPPGIRLAASTDRQARYFGTELVGTGPYPFGPPSVNRPVDLEVAPIKALG